MAGLGRKVFTAGDVLTASDVQNYMMDQTVMNFAGTAARSSAIATPTDGMVTYNQSNDSIEAYNGTAWIGMSGLQLIKTQTIGSGVSSVAVTNAFSATYNNYFVVLDGTTGSNTNAGLILQFGSTTTGYYGVLNYCNYNTNTALAIGTNNGSNFIYTGAVSSVGVNFGVQIFQPFLSTVTRIFNSFAEDTAAGTTVGTLRNTTSYTGFTLSVSAGTITGGTLRVYGMGL